MFPSANTNTYHVARPTGRCAITGCALEPGQGYIATLIEVEDETPTEADDHTPAAPATDRGEPALRRVDVSLEAWRQGRRPERMFCYWQSTVPQPHQKPSTLINDDGLMDLLYRLADSEDPRRLSLRFVVALLLMRRKKLRHVGLETSPTDTDRRQWWLMTARGQGQPIKVLNPQLDEEQIAQVSELLDEVMA